jgi:hypothetical protein
MKLPFTFVEHYNIADVKPATYNPRKIGHSERKTLTASLKRFGMVEPVILNEDGTVISGHQRIEIWRELGNETIPAKVYSVDKLTEKKMNVALNSELLQGDWDEDKLLMILEDLDLTMYDDLELGYINTGMIRNETTENVLDTGTDKGAGEYLRIFRLHFLPDEWRFFEETAKERMKEHNLANYSEYILWLTKQ